MRVKWIFFVLLIAIVGCTSNKDLSRGSVSSVPGEGPDGHGLWYNLPKTVIRVEMVAEKVVVKPGPFYRYSQRLLNITDVKTEPLEEWRIAGASVSAYGMPDPKRQYRISVEGSPSLAAVSLTSDGILAGININGYHSREITESKPEEVITLESVNFQNVPFTEEQLIKSSTAAMAEEVAKEIYRLRQLRNQLLQGELEALPADEGSYRQTLAEIDRQEKAFMELFTGKEVIQTVKRCYDFVPEEGQNLNTVLLRFSHQNGFLDAMDMSGTPVYIEVNVDTRQFKNFVAEETSKSLNTSGLVYCKPVVAEVKIIDRTLLLTQQEVQLAQFGKLLRLPSGMLDQKNVGVVLDVATGNLIQVFYK